jgi:hypothetical protein
MGRLSDNSKNKDFYIGSAAPDIKILNIYD